MKTCPRCELIPEVLLEGRLYLVPPKTHNQNKLSRYLQDAQGIATTEPYPGIYSIEVDRPTLERLCNERFGYMTPLELEDARCLLLPSGTTPSLADLVQMKSLQNLIASVEGQWLYGMLRDKRLLTYFQPIVETQHPDKVMAYECLIRGQEADGAMTYRDNMFSIAKAADLLFQLDRSARLCAIRDAKKHAVEAQIFINFIPSAIYDPQFCLQTTVAAIKETNLKKEQFVFEVVESEEVQDSDHLLSILDYYRSNGFRVALDDLGAGYSSLNLLHRLRPDFIKLDRDLVQDVEQDPYKAQISATLLGLARELGVQTIAEGIETVGEWKWLKEHGADFVQGYLFARPAEAPGTPQAPISS